MDINKVTLSGQAISDPTHTNLRGASRTPICQFLLQVNERYYDSGSKRTECRPSVFSIETLGGKAQNVFNLVRKGMRLMVEGYIRSYGNDHSQISVRTFSVTREERHEAEHYYEGLESALEVLRTSRDKEAATTAIQELLCEARDAERK